MLVGMANPLSRLKPKRRWMQFSIRTVLVLVTLIGVALSLWVVPAERQRRAVAAIEKLGGNVGYVEPAWSKALPVTLFRWLPPYYFDGIGSVFLDGKKNVTDAGLAYLRGLTGLQQLYLSGESQVTDAGLVHLQGLTGLQILSLGDTQLTDAGLAHLQGLTALHRLDLNNTQITDAGMFTCNG
jgi:hypothetical protein